MKKEPHLYVDIDRELWKQMHYMVNYVNGLYDLIVTMRDSVMLMSVTLKALEQKVDELEIRDDLHKDEYELRIQAEKQVAVYEEVVKQLRDEQREAKELLDEAYRIETEELGRTPGEDDEWPEDECQRPPAGWRCTRGTHPDGTPCAAVPDEDTTEGDW